MNNTIEQLQKELYSTLKKAGRNRKIITFARILAYGGSAVYFIGVITMQVFLYSGVDTSFFYTLNPSPTVWEQYRMLIIIAPLFVLITAGSYGLAFFQKKYVEQEQRSIKRIIQAMFPDAELSLSVSDIPFVMLQQSNFFKEISANSTEAYSFGKITFKDRNREITFRDVLLNKSNRLDNIMSKSSAGSMILIIRIIFRGIFAKRIENITGSFRGMFACAELEKELKGTVIVLPDHLEKNLDYMAKNIQSLRNINGNRLVKLEDVEFEHCFAVYASDEITARYVLTPAMMLRMTELKRKYNRDIMMSFNARNFFFAVAMPEGFLTLESTSIASGKALSDLYDNIVLARDIFHDLKLN